MRSVVHASVKANYNVYDILENHPSDLCVSMQTTWSRRQGRFGRLSLPQRWSAPSALRGADGRTNNMQRADLHAL